MSTEIKISTCELREKKQRNFEERLRFIDLWVDYIKKTPNGVWSAQQKGVVDAQVDAGNIECFGKKRGRE